MAYLCPVCLDFLLYRDYNGTLAFSFDHLLIVENVQC